MDRIFQIYGSLLKLEPLDDSLDLQQLLSLLTKKNRQNRNVIKNYAKKCRLKPLPQHPITTTLSHSSDPRYSINLNHPEGILKQDHINYRNNSNQSPANILQQNTLRGKLQRLRKGCVPSLYDNNMNGTNRIENENATRRSSGVYGILPEIVEIAGQAEFTEATPQDSGSDIRNLAVVGDQNYLLFPENQIEPQLLTIEADSQRTRIQLKRRTEIARRFITNENDQKDDRHEHYFSLNSQRSPNHKNNDFSLNKITKNTPNQQFGYLSNPGVLIPAIHNPTKSTHKDSSTPSDISKKYFKLNNYSLPPEHSSNINFMIVNLNIQKNTPSTTLADSTNHNAQQSPNFCPPAHSPSIASNSRQSRLILRKTKALMREKNRSTQKRLSVDRQNVVSQAIGIALNVHNSLNLQNHNSQIYRNSPSTAHSISANHNMAASAEKYSLNGIKILKNKHSLNSMNSTNINQSTLGPASSVHNPGSVSNNSSHNIAGPHSKLISIVSYSLLPKLNVLG